MIESIDSAPAHLVRGEDAETSDQGQRASVADTPMPPQRAEVAGWAKPKYEPYKHFFENGRALCRMFNLEEGRELTATVEPGAAQCGCCKRFLGSAGLQRHPVTPTLATVVTGHGGLIQEAVEAPGIIAEQEQPAPEAA